MKQFIVIFFLFFSTITFAQVLVRDDKKPDTKFSTFDSAIISIFKKNFQGNVVITIYDNTTAFSLVNLSEKPSKLSNSGISNLKICVHDTVTRRINVSMGYPISSYSTGILFYDSLYNISIYGTNKLSPNSNLLCFSFNKVKSISNSNYLFSFPFEK